MKTWKKKHRLMSVRFIIESTWQILKSVRDTKNAKNISANKNYLLEQQVLYVTNLE